MVLDATRRGGVGRWSGWGQLAFGMTQQVAPENLAIIGNVADDSSYTGCTFPPSRHIDVYAGGRREPGSRLGR